eukprot:Protomagalhaensia_wolfi_Nauph_80__626@NODE_1357_length_1566_cov_21_058284_g1049_i0_p1_GENE_NODE_1357_length_1566_cov_21_058284_g1049_i0NODE_1357_length_1566_cov_21_058284_g1049_i0_p1_ORF_typecomplete_len323_score43_32Fbox/PF00646_33/0_16_NODE_1357_length_1566_cov_21_058284_g1049_i03041272
MTKAILPTILSNVVQYLNAADRYRFAQLCQATRQMVYTREMEIDALMEFLKMGAPQFSVKGSPFLLEKTHPVIIKGRREALWDSIRSWHGVVARIKSCGYEIQWGDKVFGITVKESTKGFYASYTAKIVDSRGSGYSQYPHDLLSLSNVPSIHKERAALRVIIRILCSKAPISHAAVAIMILRDNPDRRDLALKHAGCFLKTLFAEGGGPNRAGVPSSMDRFFFWEYVTETEGPICKQFTTNLKQFTTNLKDLSDRVLSENMLFVALKSKGFQPMVDMKDGTDPTGKATFTHVKHEYELTNGQWTSHFTLLGRNTALLEEIV